MSNRGHRYLQDQFDDDDAFLLQPGNGGGDAGYIEVAPDGYYAAGAPPRPETDAELAARLQREELYDIELTALPAVAASPAPTAIRPGHAVCSALFSLAVTAAFAAACLAPMITTAVLETEVDGSLAPYPNGTVVATGIFFVETCPAGASAADWAAAFADGVNGTGACTISPVDCHAPATADACLQDPGWCSAGKAFSLVGVTLGVLGALVTALAWKCRAAAKAGRLALTLAAVSAALIAGYYGAVFGGCSVPEVPSTEVAIGELGSGFYFTVWLSIALLGAAFVAPGGSAGARGTGSAALVFFVCCMFLIWIVAT